VAVTEGDYFEAQTRANTSANLQASENTYFGLEVVEQSEMSSALVRMSANQTIPASTQTVVDWGSEVHDDAGYWDAGSPSRLTVPAGVDVVILTAYAAFPNNNTGDRWIEIRKNGSDTVAGMMLPESPVSDNDRVYAQSPPLKVVAGDYFEVLVWQGSGGDLDLLDANTTFFSIEGLPA
jgi:hypothetical protein